MGNKFAQRVLRRAVVALGAALVGWLADRYLFTEE